MNNDRDSRHGMDCWNPSDVQNWLAKNDFTDMYSKVFADSDIDGETLMTMTMEELLADVLEVDPEDIDDDMRGAHWALLYKIWDAMMEEYTPQTSHLMDRCAKSEMHKWFANNELMGTYIKVFACGESDGMMLVTVDELVLEVQTLLDIWDAPVAISNGGNTN